MKSLFFDDSLMFINQKASEEQSSPSSPSIITDQIRDCNNRDFKFLNSFLGRWGTEVTMGASQGGIIDTMLTLDGDSNYKDKGEIDKLTFSMLEQEEEEMLNKAIEDSLKEKPAEDKIEDHIPSFKPGDRVVNSFGKGTVMDGDYLVGSNSVNVKFDDHQDRKFTILKSLLRKLD